MTEKSESNPVNTVARGLLSRYPSDSGWRIVAGGACTLALVLSAGCAGIAPTGQGSLTSHVEYMTRAARADDQVRDRMMREAERQAEQEPLIGTLRVAFLLTSPGQSEADTQTGEQMLREVLAGRPDLAPPLKDLVELRLAEVEARQAIHTELRDVEAKIDELLSIDSNMEKKKSQEKTRPR